MYALFPQGLAKRSIAGTILYWLLAGSLLSGCGPDQVGSFLSVARQNVLLVVSQEPTHAAVSMYDLDGNIIGRVTDFKPEAAALRGITPFDAESFLVSLDIADRIERVFFDGTSETFHGSALFSGNIYDIQAAANGLFYAIESNNIEAFNSDGTRNTTALIATTTGSCVLNTPRAMTLDSNGYLIVTAVGGTDNIHIYDVSNTSASCVSSVAFGNDPSGVVAHSDGYLYVTTQGDDKVYRANANGSSPSVVWNTDLSIIRDPTAIIEMPDGTLLVASSYTDTIERIQTDGTRVGSVPFISDVFSNNITDMMIVEGGTQ